MKLYQLFDKVFEDEKFCFNAKDDKEALNKATGWIRYHSHSKDDYSLIQIDIPKYKDNIHNEWVWKN